MADPSASNTASPRQAITLYAAGGRVYASNVEQELVDLGALTAQDGGYAYLLDGNKQAAQGLASPEAALRHVADHTPFLYIDGQFTALADVRAQVDLADAARIEVMLDEFKSGEPAQDATV